MIVTKQLVRFFLFVIGGLAGTQTVLADLYRYTNDQGVLEVSSNIPTQYVKRGYEIVDSSGNVIRTVAPQMSDEEYALRKKEIDEKAAYDKAVRRVMTLYASEEDIDMAETTKVRSIERFIAEARGDIVRLKSEKARLEERAALEERAGRATPAETIRYLNALDKRLDDRELEVETRLNEIKMAKIQFEADRKLFREVISTRYDARR